MSKLSFKNSFILLTTVLVVAFIIGGFPSKALADGAITSATYNATTGNLVLTGTGFDVGHVIDVTKLNILGKASASSTLTAATTNPTPASALSATVVIAGVDKIAVDALLDKTGTASSDAITYNLVANALWQPTFSADLTTPITVSNAAANAVITSSTYDATTGNLVLTGTGFDTGTKIDITKLTIKGKASATKVLTSESASPTPDSDTSATVVIAGTDKTAVDALLDKTGTSSSDVVDYNVAAATSWQTAAAADLTLNPITVTVASINIAAIPGVTAPAIWVTPVATITATSQYTGSVTWAPANDRFYAGVVYTATITLTPTAGYTLTGVAANFFTVTGVTAVSNPINSGVVTAVFPAWEGGGGSYTTTTPAVTETPPENPSGCSGGNKYNTSTGQLCDNNAIANANANASFNRNLTVGTIGDDAKALQVWLNAHGYTVALSGPGSSGNETTKFGGLTRAALAKFQAKVGISPAVGYFGPITRAYLSTHQ